MTNENVRRDYISEAVASAIPGDTYFDLQWHLHNTGQNGGVAGIDLNVLPIWDQYKGSGITIGVIDDGVDGAHEDLSANYNPLLSWNTVDHNADASPSDARGDAHGTAVAGVIAADDNGLGVVGVAPDAQVAGLQIGFGANGTIGQIDEAFARSIQFDIVNNSWGFVSSFADNFDRSFLATAASNMMNAVENGRGGLGTNIVFAAGNDRAEGADVNYHNFQNSPYTIAVGGITNQGTFSSFSTPGAAILVSAPGERIATTDNMGASGYVGSDYLFISGTSFAAPAVSGVIALMLDANENLGYRDVQEILAYSARQVDEGFSDWQYNGAGNWNGGGLHFSHQYGYGLVDAAAAVRLAEVWQGRSVYANIEKAAASNNVTAPIPDAGNGTLSSALTVQKDVLIEQVQVNIDITHTHIGHLDVVLISPTGTRAILVNNSGASPYNSDDPGSSGNNIDFALNSVSFWGEQSSGEWRIEITDRITGDVGTLNNWSLEVIGDVITADDVYIYTDEFSKVAASQNSARTVLKDSNGGMDTLNLAAVSAETQIDLNRTETSLIAGQSLTIDAVIEDVIGGANKDTIKGNAEGNNLRGRGGDDALYGLAGDDILRGDAGNDILDGGDGVDTALYNEAAHSVDVSLATGIAKIQNDTDRLFAIENVEGSDQADEIIGSSGANTLKGNDGDDKLYGGMGADILYGGAGSDILYGAMAGDTLYGDDGNDILHGENGDDTLHGGRGDDVLYGGSGNDALYGEEGHDSIRSGGGNDTVYGGNGNDTLNGDDGHDVLYGHAGDDIILGGAGNDSIYGGSGFDRLYGNAGQDTFIFESFDTGNIYDSILDFSYSSNADRIDLSALLSAFDGETDSLSDYIRVSQTSSLGTRIDVSATGDGNFVGVADVYGEGISGHSVDDLVASGHFLI